MLNISILNLGFFYIDPLYLGILIVAGILSFGASALVKSRFAAASRVALRSGSNGAAVARAILQAEGIDDVEVVETHGFLSDHYNPMNKTLALSRDVYHGTNAAAAGVAAHEVGHAIQHARGYVLLWFRSLIVPAANFGSMLGPWIVIIGIVMMYAGSAFGQNVAVVGVVLFGIATLFTLVTVPVEFDASARAKERLQTLGITCSAEEDQAVRGVLTAAGLTYVAAAFAAILQLLYWAYRAGLFGNNR